MKLSLFSSLCFKDHQTAMVGKWKVNYIAFEGPSNSGNAPVAIIGGAFQKFDSFKKEVEHLIEKSPVILIDLPGQGGNDQVGAELSFEGLTDVLAQFLKQVNIPKITPIAMSYGSAIGYSFATRYPELVDKLILVGSTPSVRSSVRLLLEESINAVKDQRMEEFSTGVILNLLNYSQRKRTRIPRILIRQFKKTLRALSLNEQERYIANTTRLLELEDFGDAPECPVLVIAGEYDNFTTPIEGHTISKTCPQGSFFIMKGVDHLAPFINKKPLIAAYLSFIENGAVKDIDGLFKYDHAEIPLEKQILEPRYHYQKNVQVSHIDEEWSRTAKVIDISNYGFKIDLSELKLDTNDYSKLVLEFPEDDLEIETILIDQCEEGIARGIFKRYDFDKYETIESLVANVGQSQLVNPIISLTS